MAKCQNFSHHILLTQPAVETSVTRKLQLRTAKLVFLVQIKIERDTHENIHRLRNHGSTSVQY